MTPLLEKLKERLITIQRNDRSLHLKKLYLSKTLDLAKYISIDTIQKKKSFTITPDTFALHKDLTDQYKEKGVYEIYIGYPFISGTFEDGTPYACPLYLYPVTVEKVKKELKITFVDEPFLNKTLSRGFEKYSQVDSSEMKFDYEHKVLKSFTYTEPSAQKILPFAVLGQFNQQKSAVAQDYDQIMNEQRSNVLLDGLLGKEQATPEYVESPEHNNYFLHVLDKSQEESLVKSREHSYVIHGPPGTGKSQVITSSISDHIARGKKILVVCEKRAALDVVYNRLRKIQKYCLLIHNSTLDRTPLCTQIATTLENPKKEIAKESHFDETFSQLSAQIKTIYEPNMFGVTLQQMYEKTSISDTDLLEIDRKDAQEYTFAKMKKLSETLTTIQTIAQSLNENHPLFHRKKIALESDIPLRKIFQKIVDISTEFDTLFTTDYIRKDITLLPFTKDEIFTLPKKIQLFNKYKDAPIRIANPFYLQTASELKKLFRERDVSELEKRWTKLQSPLLQLQTELKKLKPFFRKEFFAQFYTALNEAQPLSPIANKCLSSLSLINKIIHHDSIKLNSFEKNIYTQLLAHKDWEILIQKSFFHSWIRILEEKQIPIEIDSLQKKLEEQLLQKAQDMDETISAQLTEKIVRIGNQKTVKQIIHDVSKKRNKLSVRQIFELPILDFFPCVLCSPESVSTILPLKEQFDVVIFDEASQLRIEKAIPSLLRAKKAIIAGDEHQLPPTNFFDTIEYEQGDDMLEDESLLIRAKTVFPTHKLTYHYRSKYPELISFSNKHFYNSELQVIPSVTESKTPPISYVYCKGVWKNNQNEIEAKKILEVLKECSKNKKTVGIVTFNQTQKDLIETLIEKEANKTTAFAKWLNFQLNRYEDESFVGLFVKNIEQVQGDERDTIIFSVAYGFDTAKKFKFNFGPLNGIYGPNRLNVAVSRAKEQIIFVSSFEPSDFMYKGSAQGVLLLKEYLQFAKGISTKKIEKETPDLSVFQSKIVQHLDSYDVYEHIFTHKHVLITDSHKNIKETFVTRPIILKKFGWKTDFFLSKDWWRDEKTQISRIQKILKES